MLQYQSKQRFLVTKAVGQAKEKEEEEGEKEEEEMEEEEEEEIILWS